jgi:hypothetical protein
MATSQLMVEIFYYRRKKKLNYSIKNRKPKNGCGHYSAPKNLLMEKHAGVCG